MTSYNLTDKQKYLLMTVVKRRETGQLDEPIIPCSICSIIGIEEDFGHNLLGDLDALCDVDLMGFRYSSKGNKIYTVKKSGYDAVKNDFEIPEKPAITQLNIGAIIKEMKGGTLQATGFANESEVKQIVNDPQLLSDRINTLTNQLLEVLKADLSAEKLFAYVKLIDELKKEIALDKPSPSVLKRLFNSLAFIGDVEGTISLAARVWSYIYPILVIAAEKVTVAG